GIAGRVWAAELDAFRLGVRRVHGDATGSRAIACRVAEIDRRLEARHQPPVRVDGWRTDRAQRRGVLQEPADVIKAFLADIRIFVASKYWGVALPDALVDMHPRAIIPKERLGHKGGGHAALACHVLYHVFVDHYVVGHPGQLGKAHIDLALATGRDLMMVSFNRNPELFKHRHHMGTRILESIGRWHR